GLRGVEVGEELRRKRREESRTARGAARMGRWTVATLLVLASCVLATVDAGKPNILLVLVDDLGWGNLGFRAGDPHEHATTKEEMVTPTIDGLVKTGLLLNRHYTFNFCSPTRSALQTGRLPVHVVVNDVDPINHNPDDPVSGFSGIPRMMTGLAEKMREAGYRTAMTGKWDAGMATHEQTPMGRGYETFVGYFHHANDYWEQTLGGPSTGKVDKCYEQGHHIVDLWNTTGPAVGRNGTVYEEEIFTENSLKVIREHDTKDPLFLFHSFHLIHTPLEVPKDFEDKFAFLKEVGQRKYAAMVNYMDTALGKIVDALKAKGMWDNTLMVLSSDNGGPIYASVDPVDVLNPPIFGGANNLPLRGGKLSDWEGGIRVNAFVSGGFLPEKQRGKTLEHYVHVADWYTTFCDIVGVDAHDGRAAKYNLPAVDGINQWPLISGKVDKALRTEMYISRNTLIQGDWKVITGSDPDIFIGGVIPLPDSKLLHKTVPMNGYWAGYGINAIARTLTSFKLCIPACMYNIKEDPNEHHDIFHKNKELGRKMMARLDELNESYFEPDRGTQHLESCDVFLNKYGGFYGPFLDLPTPPEPPAAPQRVATDSEARKMARVAEMALALLAAMLAMGQVEAGKPNILLVLVDDLGWGNLGFRAGDPHKHATTKEEMVTPTIDALVEQGLLLNRHYTYNYCSPTRSSLQTGRLPVHVAVDNIDPIAYNAEDSGFSGIPRMMTGLAEKMHEAGYCTAMTGKWDAGMATHEQRRWDFEDKFAFLKDESRRKYAAMVNCMDTALGKIVGALKAKGMWDNTLMVLSSDNGGPIYATPSPFHLLEAPIFGGANNLPLRGGKLSDWEGGIRVNAFVSGGFLPKKQRGKTLEHYVHVADWYTTFCGIAGVDSFDARAAKYNLPAVDGVNQWPLIAGEVDDPVRTEIYISKFTLIQGDLKIITGSDLNIFNSGGLPFPDSKLAHKIVPFSGYWPGYGAEAVGHTLSSISLCLPACLFNIKEDPNEHHDIFHKNKELGRKMMARLDELNESYFEPDRGTQHLESCDVFINKYGGFYGPFLDLPTPIPHVSDSQALRDTLRNRMRSARGVVGGMRVTVRSAVLLLAAMTGGVLTARVDAGKPNILLVLVDDLGWGNLGFRAGDPHKHATTKEEMVTPTIDALVEHGLLLNRHYTFNFCSPTRSALQTGRLPVHVVVDNIDPIAYNPKDPVSGFSGVPRMMTGLAEKMREAGYRTAMTGKWDAGMATHEQTPMGRGYETFVGYFHHANDYWEQTTSGPSTGTVDMCVQQGHHIVDLWNTTGPA
ncbi:Arylsulfatase B (ASB) (N-acetylgalactosamine-4-sulfatase) (G4S), partial [Durusdinium trenchii]